MAVAPDISSLHEVAAGTPLFREGDEADGAYLVAEGKIEVRRLDAGGRVEVAVLTAGDVVGEMALIEGGARSADATATERSRLIHISREEFEQRLGSVDPIMRQILRILVRRLLESNERLSGEGPP